jgi:hypothetical protein
MNFVSLKAFWGILFMVLVFAVLAAFATPNNSYSNDATKDEIALGKQLFFDPILSSDSSGWMQLTCVCFKLYTFSIFIAPVFYLVQFN